MSWIDQRSKAAQVTIVNHLPTSQPKCQAQVHMFGYDNDKPRRDLPVPKGKNTTICLGRQGKGINDIQSSAQARAVEFSERGHKLQRLDRKSDELEQRSPERCQQTSITSIAHRDLMAGGIESVLRRSGVDAGNGLKTQKGINNNSPSRGGPSAAGGGGAGSQEGGGGAAGTMMMMKTNKDGRMDGGGGDDDDDDDVPSLEVLADEGWAKSRVDPDKIRDPYLRQQGLHINDAGVYSHISKRLVSSRALTKAIVDKSVDFNFQYTKKR